MPTTTTATGVVANAVEIAKAARKLQEARRELIATARELYTTIEHSHGADVDELGLSLEASMDLQRRLEWLVRDVGGPDLTGVEEGESGEFEVRIEIVQRQTDELVDLADYHTRRSES
jgi:hypothetical protein